ncbi:hypothetical protein BP00DRAFT_200976 [Aspergillus indologenus CBS 114.80]|uniref:Uncharacterized protein n=1 Tax=Aspergillus indologenus CBS 114.80 TaxID=1450541 RepID=A0A2V5I6C7_9EURO|nr:hypothetical protein BP00DRAFT_200976 [Aspergillus indologenus CBS 114.80]
MLDIARYQLSHNQEFCFLLLVICYLFLSVFHKTSGSFVTSAWSKPSPTRTSMLVSESNVRRAHESSLHSMASNLLVFIQVLGIELPRGSRTTYTGISGSQQTNLLLKIDHDVESYQDLQYLDTIRRLANLMTSVQKIMVVPQLYSPDKSIDQFRFTITNKLTRNVSTLWRRVVLLGKSADVAQARYEGLRTIVRRKPAFRATGLVRAIGQ